MKAIPKQLKRIQSEKHRRFVAQHKCIVCTGGYLVFIGHTVSQCCHVRIGFFTKGKRPCDTKTVPMCDNHHTEQHAMNEQKFWGEHEIDPFEVAALLAKASPAKSIGETAV